jgi:hypothetical protein
MKAPGSSFTAMLVLVIISYSIVALSSGDDNSTYKMQIEGSIIRAQVLLEANDMRSFIWNSGIFNQDLRTNNTPGLEWPKNSGKFAVFTTGLTVAAYVNNQLRMSAALYNGEYVPGYCVNSVLQTNTNFKLYRVTRGDNQNTNPDWANWGLMVPYGAPFKDNNSNGVYEPAIDVPGIKDAAQTVFICMTDADVSVHTPSEGFGGGTAPMFNEVHFTSWCYDNSGYEYIQFFKWVVINKNTTAWDSTIFSIVSDPDLGVVEDDYIGCDSSRNLGYCYNADNSDGDGSGRTYGANPPAVGMMFFNCSGSNSKLTSFCYIGRSSNITICEREPSNPLHAYNYMKGFKRDGTPWVIPNTNPPQTTKFIYSGEPETNSGWTEYNGRINNCDGSLTGELTVPSPAGDRKFIMNYSPSVVTINPGDSQVIMAAQLINRGNNNLNSVTRLKELSDVAKNLCQNGFVIGINPISSEVPNRYRLHQNYPNPFNPVTKIKFEIPVWNGRDRSALIIYDALGREITTLVDEKLNAGVYSIDWDGTNYPSGVYFYQLTSGSYSETKKMVMIK